MVLQVLEYARKHPCKKFIQFSTDESLGAAPHGQFHQEWDPHLPSNPYSASKAAQEDIAISYWRTYGVPVVITHCMNVIGERQDSEKFVPMVMKKVLAGEEVGIHGTPDGKQSGSRFYLHARNIADALLYILKYVPINAYPTDDRPSSYNVVGEKEINNLDMAELVAKYVGKPLRYTITDAHSARPGHDLRYALDGSKIRDAGWKQPLNLEDSLKKTVAWTLEHPYWLK